MLFKQSEQLYSRPLKPMERRTLLYIYEFYNLGLGDPMPISATNAQGIGDVLDAIYEKFPKDEVEEDDDGRIKVAVIGSFRIIL